MDLRDSSLQNTLLSIFPAEDIWGVGHRLVKRLAKLNIFTARELRDADPKYIRSHFSVVLERMVLELRGTSCLPLETIQPRKEIISSRSFGKAITQLNDLHEAISSYSARACIKLRKQKSLTQGLMVFLQTNRFHSPEDQYSNSLYYHFNEATDDTGFIITIAKKMMTQLYRKNYRYHKAGIMLLHLIPNTHEQLSLFGNNEKRSQLMKTVDHINQVLGKKTLFFCAEGIKPSWSMQRNLLSHCYTTRINELLIANCRM